MSEDRIEMLKGYIESGISPIMVEDMPSNFLDNTLVLEANIPDEDLNGYYDENNYLPPKWYVELEEMSKKGNVILLIENINKVSFDIQRRFIDILKYNKIGTFKLPSNCIIFVTCSDLENNKICEEVYSLLPHI